MPEVTVSVTVLAYGAEPWLEPCVNAVLQSRGVMTDVVLVDNGCTDGAVERLAQHDCVTVVRPGGNLGFPGGCNLGAEHSRGEVLAFVNSDAIVEPDALARLSEYALRPEVGIATASVRLADQPTRLNSGGNDIHFLGLSWSGAFGDRADNHARARYVAGASGAAMALSRATWDRLGGFEPRYFLYHEDAELSLRCWQQGLPVVFVPEAVVRHRYEFSRNRQKFHLIERNRLILLLTLFERRTLLLLSPALSALELAMLASATRRGWIADKVSGWSWLVQNRRWLRDRRCQVQQERSVSDAELAPLLATRIDPGNFELPSWLRPLDWLLQIYWAAVVRLLRGRGTPGKPLSPLDDVLRNTGIQRARIDPEVLPLPPQGSDLF